MCTLYNKFTVLHAVLGDLILIERVIFSCSVGADLALHDLHNAPLLIFKLLCVYDYGKRLGNQIQNYRIVDIRIFSLAKRHHSAPSGFTRIRVNSGNYRMSRSCRFLSRICLAASHLTNYDIIGVEAKCHIQQVILGYGFAVIFGFARYGVYNFVQYFIFFIAHHQVQLAGAAFNRKNSLVVGNSGKQPTRQCGFARRSRSSDSR